MRKHRPAVFLDRDGTLIEDVGVLAHPEDIHLFAGTISALRQLQEKYLLFVITNQPGVAGGSITADQVAGVNKCLDEMLSLEGIRIKDWYVCPHAREDECCCIKPNPFFLLQAAKDYDLDLHRSFMVGDHPHDVLTGDPVGTFGLYLLTGHGQKHLGELSPERIVFHTISDAAAWIIDHPDREVDLHNAIRTGADAIRRGGLVAFPTETVYGLGADALNPKAVARIFEAKKRPLHDPLIIHVSNKQQVPSLVLTLPREAEVLMEHFWPGSLTLVLPKSPQVPDIVTAGNSTVAIRMPANPWALELIRLAMTPIAAPSANRFGCTSPTTAQHVKDHLNGHYEILIDGGACRVGVESTVLSLIGNSQVLLRPGGVTQQDIEALIGPVQNGCVGKTKGNKFASPGMMPKHYAPNTLLIVAENIDGYSTRSDVGAISFGSSLCSFQGPVECLSRDGDLKEAASNLYRVMRTLDGMGLSLIIAQSVPNIGLGVTINDRLNKAASRSPSQFSPKGIHCHR